jgi:nucleotide-binding universal stress UspA family protein
MYTHILVPTDGSELSDKATQAAIELAKRLGALLHAFTVTEPYPYSPLAEAQPILPQEFLDAARSQADRFLKRVRELAAAAGVACEGSHVEAAQPWRAICERAGELGCDCIVMASHGRSGLAGLLLGSETQKVLTHCQLPVLVVR